MADPGPRAVAGPSPSAATSGAAPASSPRLVLLPTDIGQEYNRSEPSCQEHRRTLEVFDRSKNGLKLRIWVEEKSSKPPRLLAAIEVSSAVQEWRTSRPWAHPHVQLPKTPNPVSAGRQRLRRGWTRPQRSPAPRGSVMTRTARSPVAKAPVRAPIWPLPVSATCRDDLATACPHPASGGGSGGRAGVAAHLSSIDHQLLVLLNTESGRRRAGRRGRSWWRTAGRGSSLRASRRGSTR